MRHPVVPRKGIHIALCLICRRPATVSWPVRNNPHCMACVEAARAFLASVTPERGVDPLEVRP